jgi:hypothetical protein
MGVIARAGGGHKRISPPGIVVTRVRPRFRCGNFDDPFGVRVRLRPYPAVALEDSLDRRLLANRPSAWHRAPGARLATGEQTFGLAPRV